ncbi:LacI family DNA-binding transcriptional regulator [Desulfobacula sp.]
MTRITIKDIARQLKVSTTTVSNALNDKPGVGKLVRGKIVQMAKDMGYQPNYFAKGLVSKQSLAIGLIVSSIADPFYPELALAVQEKANELGYTMMLFNTNHKVENETRIIEMLKSRGADGIILSTTLQDDPNIDLLNEVELPYVLVNRVILNPKKDSRIDSVSLDNYGGSHKAARHLCRLGHTKIGIIAGDMQASTAILRTQGAQDALDEFGIIVKPELFVECGYSKTIAYKAAQRMLARKNRPTALLIQGDNMALGVREAAFEIGLKIPEDLAIIGFDDISISSLAGIELTTVSQNQYNMGMTGAELLINKIKGQNQFGVSNKIVMEAELIIRNTCGFNLKGYVK